MENFRKISRSQIEYVATKITIEPNVDACKVTNNPFTYSSTYTKIGSKLISSVGRILAIFSYSPLKIPAPWSVMTYVDKVTMD